MPHRSMPVTHAEVNPNDASIELHNALGGRIISKVNRGKAEKFDVVVEPVGQVQVTTGGGARKITVKSGESGVLALMVKAMDSGETCNGLSRGLKVTARPEGVSTEKACATFETRFFCPPQKKSAAGM